MNALNYLKNLCHEQRSFPIAREGMKNRYFEFPCTSSSSQIYGKGLSLTILVFSVSPLSLPLPLHTPSSASLIPGSHMWLALSCSLPDGFSSAHIRTQLWDQFRAQLFTKIWNIPKIITFRQGWFVKANWLALVIKIQDSTPNSLHKRRKTWFVCPCSVFSS